MRFDKPIGIWLLLFPALWALWIAGQGAPSLINVVIITLGSVLMRAAGCVVNDMADRNFDKHVARTKDRPLTSGQITLLEAQVIFLSLVLCSAGLLFFLNKLCLELACIALFLACLYPFTKRWVSYPQFFLSLAFGMGIPIAYAAQVNQLNLMTVFLYSLNILWVFIYDTEYAMADRKDDLRIKIKSTAIWWGKYDIALIICLQLMMVIMLVLLGLKLNFYNVYFAPISIVTLLFCYQIKLISSRDPHRCLNAFKNNQWVGVIIFLGLVLGI